MKNKRKLTLHHTKLEKHCSWLQVVLFYLNKNSKCREIGLWSSWTEGRISSSEHPLSVLSCRWYASTRLWETPSASSPHSTACIPTSSCPMMGLWAGTETRWSSGGTWKSTCLCRKYTAVSTLGIQPWHPGWGPAVGQGALLPFEWKGPK